VFFGEKITRHAMLKLGLEGAWPRVNTLGERKDYNRRRSVFNTLISIASSLRGSRFGYMCVCVCVCVCVGGEGGVYSHYICQIVSCCFYVRFTCSNIRVY